MLYYMQFVIAKNDHLLSKLSLYVVVSYDCRGDCRWASIVLTMHPFDSGSDNPTHDFQRKMEVKADGI